MHATGNTGVRPTRPWWSSGSNRPEAGPCRLGLVEPGSFATDRAVGRGQHPGAEMLASAEGIQARQLAEQRLSISRTQLGHRVTYLARAGSRTETVRLTVLQVAAERRSLRQPDLHAAAMGSDESSAGGRQMPNHFVPPVAGERDSRRAECRHATLVGASVRRPGHGGQQCGCDLAWDRETPQRERDALARRHRW